MVKKLLNICKRAIKKLNPRKRDQNVAQEKENSKRPFWKKVLPQRLKRKRKHQTQNIVIRNKFKDSISSPSLPTECLIEVFTYIQDDLKTLNACLLVCKEWCNVVVPLYWSRPFHCKTSGNVIKTYLQCLSKHEQQNIKACGIKLKRNKTPPTFHYADLLRELSMSKLYLSVDAWIHISQRSISNITNQRNIICRALCKLFVNKSQGLLSLSLDWSHSGKWRNYPMFTYHTKNSSIISDLQDLSIHHVDTRDIFNELSWCCQNLKTLEIIDYTFLNLSEIRHRSIHTLISSQINLQSCKFFGYGSSPIQPIDALKTQFKTLTHFELIYAKFYMNNSIL